MDAGISSIQVKGVRRVPKDKERESREAISRLMEQYGSRLLRLCALYLKGLLTGEEVPDIDGKLKGLRTGGGSHFFDPAQQDVFPEKDFWMCIDRDRFNFVLRAEKDRDGLLSRKIG